MMRMPKCQSMKMLQIRRNSRRITHLLYKNKIQINNKIIKPKTSTKRQESKNEQKVATYKRKIRTFYKEENKKQNKIQMEKMGNKKQKNILKVKVKIKIRLRKQIKNKITFKIEIINHEVKKSYNY